MLGLDGNRRIVANVGVHGAKVICTWSNYELEVSVPLQCLRDMIRGKSVLSVPQEIAIALVSTSMLQKLFEAEKRNPRDMIAHGESGHLDALAEFSDWVMLQT